MVNEDYQSRKLWWTAAPSADELGQRVARLLTAAPEAPPVGGRGLYRFAAWYTHPSEVRAAWHASPVTEPAEPPRVAFLYSGQGAQYAGMASELSDIWPWFRSGMQRLFDHAAQYADASWSDVLLGMEGTDGLIDQTAFTQPIVYALQIQLTQVWSRWGLHPSAVMGHSLGEFAAACTAGVFSGLDGLRLVSERGRLMQELPRNGKYVLVTGEFADIAELVRPYASTVAIAGVNAPNLIVVSGFATDVDQILFRCQALNMKVRELPVSLPFHSPLMNPVLDDFEAYCCRFEFRRPSISWISGVTGQEFSGDLAPDANYWRRQIRDPVRLWAALYELANRGRTAFLEIGPGHAVLSMGKSAVDPERHLWLPSLDPKQSDRKTLLNTALALWRSGIEIDLEQACRDCLTAG